MKIINIIIGTLFISLSLYGQNLYLERTVSYINEKNIEQIISHNILCPEYKYVVWQHIKQNDDIDNLISVVFVNSCNKDKYLIIKNDSVLFQGFLNNDSIFQYKNYQKTGALETEKFNGFIPPFLCGINTSNIIYKDNKKSFYFEFGDNICSYLPKCSLNKYRNEWLKIIKKEVSFVFETYKTKNTTAKSL